MEILLRILTVILILVMVLGVVLFINFLFNSSSEHNAQEMIEYIDEFKRAGVSARHPAPQKDENGNWYFVTDEDFKVLHLTDIHIVGSASSVESDKKAINAVAAMVEAEDPDLVIITGDMTYAIPTLGTIDNGHAHSFFIRLMENLDVYWTVTFGNHDDEPYNTYRRDTVATFYQAEGLERCLFMESPEGVSGNGNHVINIKNSAGEVTQSLFMIDSHSYIRKDMIGGIIDSLSWNYDNIKQDQVDWYESMIEEYQPKSSLLFFHIPLMEVKTAYDEYVANGRQNTENVTFVGGHDGEEDEVVYCSRLEEQLFEKALELGNTKAMFFGHDHFNNFIIDYKGVMLSYGYSVDYIAYGDIGNKGYQRGCVVINISPDGSFDSGDIVHENYYQDKYQPLYEKEVVDMYPYFDK